MDIERFKHNIWNADNKNTGEKFAERIVSGILGSSEAENSSYDRLHQQRRLEVKSARIVADRHGNDDYPSLWERSVILSSYQNYKFCGNIQHLKLARFDDLYYVVFFRDVVLVFGMTVDQLREHAGLIGYSRQGRYMTADYDGQFSLRTCNLQVHMTKFLRNKLSYSDAHHFFTLDSDRVIRLDQSIQWRHHHMTPDQSIKLQQAIEASPPTVVADLAIRTEISTKTINLYLNTDGNGYVESGMIAVEQTGTLPLWAKTENGYKKPCVPFGSRREQRALVPLAAPTKIGVSVFDDAMSNLHRTETELLNARASAKKHLIERKETQGEIMTQVVARISDRVDAKDDLLAVKDEQIATLQEQKATLQAALDDLRSMVSILRDEITVLRTHQ